MRHIGKIALISGLGIFGGSLVIAPHLDRDSYDVVVTDKERIVESDGEGETSSKYLVFTRLENGKVRVFENTDSLLELKFNSSDIQGRLIEGGKYRIDTYGWRIPFFSAYENIVDVQEKH